MTGLRWSYKELVQYLHKSAFPVNDLNPIIERILMVHPGSSVLGIGGRSIVLLISSDVVAKVALKQGDEQLRHEQRLFDLLIQSPCQQVVQCFFRGPDVTFLERIANGTLHDRMSFINKPRPILQWMMQLSSAAACLEGFGYAHGDINPQNVLVDAMDQLKLIDFDNSLRVGNDLDIGYEPYVRQHRETVGGLYGVAGPTTEQFALGSVFWYMSRGSELYSELEGSEQVDRLLDGRFPATDVKNPIDRVIMNCWYGRYLRIADLVEDIQKILGESTQIKEAMPSKNRLEKIKECENFYGRI
jgi:serine/threonine protein kinase